MNRTIEHNSDHHRFEYVEDSMSSVLDYQLDDGIMTITHTEVPSALGGRGIAADLTRAALDVARREGWRVRPVCSYAQTYIRRHTDYQDLLA